MGKESLPEQPLDSDDWQSQRARPEPASHQSPVDKLRRAGVLNASGADRRNPRQPQAGERVALGDADVADGSLEEKGSYLS